MLAISKVLLLEVRSQTGAHPFLRLVLGMFGYDNVHQDEPHVPYPICVEVAKSRVHSSRR